MDLEKVKKQWREYSNEFATSDFMDIEDHTSMALQVGSLISEIDRVDRIARKQNDVITNLHNYIFGNEAISEEEREFLLANLNTVIRLY